MTTWQAFASAIANDHLLGSLLLNGPVADPSLERQLTAMRRRCLMAGGGPLPLLAHLAIQGFVNEYAWREDAVEAAEVEALWARVAAGETQPGLLMLLACYRPLNRLPNAAALLSNDAPAELKAVLREQVADVLQERVLAEGLPAITAIRSAVSQAVQGQYETNPYPRWVSLSAPSSAALGVFLQARYPGVDPGLLADRPQVLVAGCGTGRHAIEVARNYPGAEVLAVDLSRASLGYAARKTRELGLANVEYAQADLMELGSLGRTFDIVESVGVLHHLEDPFEGARILTALLRPGGLFRLGLYSATARAAYAPAKALARAYGPGRIRELRAAIIDLPASDPARAALTAGDFYASSPCRDLLMHVQEHELGIADLRRMLDENGLRFAGFQLPQPVRATYREMFPHDPKGLDLDLWSAFEEAHPATFQRMYQFAAQKPA